MHETKWNILSKIICKNEKDLLTIILKNREITEEKEFLSPPFPLEFALNDKELKSLINKNINPAANLILKTMKNNNPIVIHGDYDADGQTATAILWKTLFEVFNYEKVYPYIPSRFDEGYGLTMDSLNGIIEKLETTGYVIKSCDPLIVTVDCGILSIAEVDTAKELGFSVIITDHHQKGKALPNADHVIHTTKSTGAGIAWLLSQFILNNSDIKNSDNNSFIDLAAIGTICDLQPLTGFNRSIAKHGLEKINNEPSIGIKALIESAGINGEIDSYHIGWQIGPRLNATGRMEDAMQSLRLLCSRSVKEAEDISKSLNELNQVRQNKTQGDLLIALSEFENIKKEDLPAILITINESYHEGIVGLVAGRLSQTFNRAVLAISIDNKTGIAKGSARSVKGISIINELREYAHLFDGLGGHDQAAGFSIKISKLEELKSSLEILSKKWTGKNLVKEINIDTELDPNLVNMNVYDSLQTLRPFGVGNQEPVFMMKNLKLINYNNFGKENKHIKLFFMDENSNQFVGVGFSLNGISDLINVGENYDAAFTLTKNSWNGNSKLELIIKDIHIA
jgi:single-stranded-DNA-specific exonuclease